MKKSFLAPDKISKSKKLTTSNSAKSQASTEGNLEGVKILLDAGADINGSRDEPPIMLAALHGHSEVVKHLLEQGVNSKVQILNLGPLYNNKTYAMLFQMRLKTLARSHFFIMEDFNKTPVLSHLS